MHSQPVYRKDDSEFLGSIRKAGDIWQCLTIFDVPFATAKTQDEATEVVTRRGLAVLMEPWEFRLDKKNEWQACIILEASPQYVMVAEMHGPYPDYTKTHILQDDLPAKLQKE